MAANAAEPNAGNAGRIPGARKFGRKWSASGAVLRRVLAEGAE